MVAMINGEMRKGVLEAVKDPLYRLTRTDRTNPGATPPNQWTWNYDAVGNRTSAQKDSEATTSSYNEKNQLTGATGGGKMLWRGTLDEPGIATFSAPTINGQPARILAGNVFEATLDLPAGANTVTIQAQDGSGNVATKAYSVNVLGVPSSYTYDANGNLTTKAEGADAWVYTWNALNQLTSVSKGGATQASYSYDPLGRRVGRLAAGLPTAWTHDGETVLRQVLGSITMRFIHGPDIDEPLGSEDSGSGALTFFHVDGLRSVVRYSSQTGAASASIGYSVWGVPESGTPLLYGFAGREWDSSIALWYYRNRWYDSTGGRFISEDPLGWVAGPNAYGYVDGNPILYADPFGLIIDPTIDGPGRPRFVDRTPCGTDGCTSHRAEVTAFSDCLRRSNGTFGFDAEVKLTLIIYYKKGTDPNGMSTDPGFILDRHERERHVKTYTDAFERRSLNKRFPSEGFSCDADCQKAKQAFVDGWSDFLKKTADRSKSHDR